MSDLHAVFGGTFDPIHFGHLRAAEALAALTGLKKVTLLPNNVPPHRSQPEASPAQRLDMLRCAIADLTLFDIDARELQRDEPSWTVTTLKMMRAERGEHQPLAFIIGQDSLLSLNKWQHWQELMSLCHLLVCRRPGYDPQPEDPVLRQWIQDHLTTDVQQLRRRPAGLICLAETPLYSISATGIRQRLREGVSCSDLLPQSVINYIEQAGLYRD